MNTSEMMRILDSIARDRNIDKALLITDLEQAMVSAARRYFNTLDAEEFTCTLDPLSGEMQLFRHGEPLDMPPEDFGRIAAQTFKQVMIQRFREDERNSIFDDFSKRVGEIVTGVAQRYEGGSLVVTVDRAEAFMPRSEQIPGEQFMPGDRVRCLLLDVRDVGNQVKIVLSRSHPDFIKRLFEVEVPEVAERVIEIKGMAREAGYRTKIAVSSIDSKVDAVGACVGVRGSRIKNIVDELNGEKIDIVRWNESSQILIANALKPAEVAEISLCFELGRATVVVRDDQLSLAIGKRGQNVRLAARLTGWDVDILTPEEFNKGLEIMSETLQSVEGITEEQVDRLAALGMVSVFDLEEVGIEVLTTELEIETELGEKIMEIAAERSKVVAEQQKKDKEESLARRKAEEEAARQLLSGELASPEGEVDPEIAAAAILGAGVLPMPTSAEDAPAGEGDAAPDTPTDADADARAADILSPGEGSA
ncbi:Transcription termination protein NusA [hydrothermal vent metagenome]|uniref:Transcription termination protein NusA n=1 Tax=hydrothermal vent metagenome TaxID=652676 RepID=A0A3B1DB30_9ZZZZ